MQPGAKLQAYLGVSILQPHACAQRFRLRILRRTRSNAGRTSARSLSGRIQTIWETPSKEKVLRPKKHCTSGGRLFIRTKLLSTKLVGVSVAIHCWLSITCKLPSASVKLIQLMPPLRSLCVKTGITCPCKGCLPGQPSRSLTGLLVLALAALYGCPLTVELQLEAQTLPFLPISGP